MKITWEVSDGYVCGSRPHTTEIPDEEFDGMTEEEAEEFISDWIQEEFSQKITWYITKRA